MPFVGELAARRLAARSGRCRPRASCAGCRRCTSFALARAPEPEADAVRPRSRARRSQRGAPIRSAWRRIASAIGWRWLPSAAAAKRGRPRRRRGRRPMRHHARHLGHAERERAGLVEDDGVGLGEPLEEGRALDQHALARRERHRGERRRRHRDAHAGAEVGDEDAGQPVDDARERPGARRRRRRSAGPAGRRRARRCAAASSASRPRPRGSARCAPPPCRCRRARPRRRPVRARATLAAITRSPTWRSRGTLSPVSAFSSTARLPSTMTPSAGTRAPG